MPFDRLDGFIEVTAENQDTWISEHFRLGLPDQGPAGCVADLFVC